MESDATILGLATTRVTPEQAQAISIDAIRTSLNDTISGNSLGSIISGLSETTTTGDYTNAQSIEVLQSTIEGNADATATAIDTINTFAGIDETGAYTYTGLTGYLVDPNTGMIGGGQSELQNTITTTGDNVEAKFEYGSNIKIGGKYHNAGFGLKTTMTGGDGTANDPYNSEFWINAEKFKFTNNSMSGQATPFSIDATGLQPKITFNGLVTFGSGQSGTIEEAISSTIETVQVGDKNINISDNLIPTTSLVSDTNNAGYQFIGSPTKSMQTGISTFAEAQVTLTSGSECYSPYVDEITVPYYYRFGITGVTNVDSFKIITIDSANQETEHTLLVTLNVEVPELNPLNWYIVEGIINPIGGNSSPSGSIRDALNSKLGTINNYPMPSSVTKLLLGWTLPCTISRMKLCKINADTITESYATTDYINEVVSSSGYVRPSEVAAAINNNTTTIDGSKITTGTILADKINTTGLIAENISAEEISGKTIVGGRINGAIIEGVVIKASYLDLDGELEVLTNYHLCMTQAQLTSVIAAGGTGELYTNGTLMPDAVYIATSDEYRIPSISFISEKVDSVSNGSTITGRIRSYNTYNAGSNMKAVKIRPVFITTSGQFAFNRNSIYDNKAITLKLGHQPLVTLNFNTYSVDITTNSQCYMITTVTNHLTGVSNSATVGIYGSGLNKTVVDNYQLNIDNLPVIGTIRCEIVSTYEHVFIPGYMDNENNWVASYSAWEGYGDCKVMLTGSSAELPFDWNDSSSVLNISGSGTYSLSGISINNML